MVIHSNHSKMEALHPAGDGEVVGRVPVTRASGSNGRSPATTWSGPRGRRPGGSSAVPLRNRRVAESHHVTATACAVWTLCLAPVAVLPGAYGRWGWPVLLCVSIAGMVALRCPPAGRLPWWVWGFGVLFLVVLGLAAALGASPLAQLMGRAPRYEGMVTYPSLILAAWLGARLFGPDATPGVHRAAVQGTSLASILLGGVAALEATGLRPLESDVARPGSLAGNATDQGILGVLFLAVLVPAFITSRSGSRARAWSGVGCGFAAVAVATSASRAAYVALLILVANFVAVIVRRSARRARDGFRLLLALVAATLVTIATPTVRSRFFSGSSLAAQTISDRTVIWHDTAQVWLQSPWLGVGPSGFMDAVPAFFGRS